MSPETLKRLEEMIKLIDRGVSKDDFEKFAVKILDLVVQMEKRNSQAIADMQKTHETMLSQMQNSHNDNYTDLKGKVNDVFVGEQVNRMKTEHAQRISEMVKKLQSIKDGKTPSREELVALIKPLIPPPKEGRTGRTENLSDIHDDIKQLKEDMKKQKSRVMGGGITGRDLFKDIDISTQLDGVTKTFNIQAVWYIIDVDLSSFPYGALRKTIDYTWTNKTITFTDTIDAATQLAAGQSCIIKAVLP